ncbi:hypothetical protein RchiOBHm_Chr6g0301941 [Rosa chinensis]|uniref:Uncharacterized protein n=1 Tax=Rosa chinensis TaxID=74649 RepID=A0A2P6PYX4_ROSCH|nr:hypothetical protein RchiOBHm_Chr6g0301941 [Rosa chinensis]
MPNESSFSFIFTLLLREVAMQGYKDRGLTLQKRSAHVTTRVILRARECISKVENCFNFSIKIEEIRN